MSTTAVSVEVLSTDSRNFELEPVGFSLPGRKTTQGHVVSGPSETAARSRSDNDQIDEPREETLTNDGGISAWRATSIISVVALVTVVNNMLAGILVVSLPTMARDIGLSPDLWLWPASVNSLACGCTLLIAGSIADVVGGRKIYLIGAFLLALTTVACGVSRTGIQLILFRAAQGVAASLCLPSSVILLTSNIPTGSYRNTAFACLGAGQPLGFAVGLVLGGGLVQVSSWRVGYYIGAGIIFLVWGACFVALPAERISETQSFKTTLTRLRTEIDWTGCMLLSTSLGLFSYVFSVLSDQERLGRKVIIPPSIWANRIFACICVTIFVIWGVFDAVLFFLTLFFQDIQALSPIQTSLRFLPVVVTGTATNFLTGWLVKRVRADALILSTAAVAAISPLLMALINPEWSYWTCAFFVTCLSPICADTVFTIANLVITSVFPPQTHGVAGSVFNTMSNIGNSVGLAVTAVIASAVTMSKHNSNETKAQKQMDGYRAIFWLCFAAKVATLGFVAFGLRKIGKVGIKVD